MTYQKIIGNQLAETLDELFFIDSQGLILNEIRDPEMIRAAMDRLKGSQHPSASSKLERLQQLHQRKLAVLQAHKEREKATHQKMHEVAKKFGYRRVAGEKGNYIHKDTGHKLSIGPGNQWSHVRNGKKRATIGTTPIRSLKQHLTNLHAQF